MLTSIAEYISTRTMQILSQIGTHIGISLFALLDSSRSYGKIVCLTK